MNNCGLCLARIVYTKSFICGNKTVRKKACSKIHEICTTATLGKKAVDMRQESSVTVLCGSV